MAIAGILVTATHEHEGMVRQVLEAMPGISRIQTTDNAARLAAVLECPASEMEKALEKLKDAQSVLNVDLAYVNYEDEILS